MTRLLASLSRFAVRPSATSPRAFGARNAMRFVRIAGTLLTLASCLYVTAAQASPWARDPAAPVYASLSGLRPSSPLVGHTANHLAIAKRYLGGNPTGRRSQWCADFMNLVERKAGRKGTGSRLARSYLAYGTKVSNPRPGDIVVLWRGSPRSASGHVGYVLGFIDGGVQVISGNHGRTVGIGTYPKSRVLGYRRP